MVEALVSGVARFKAGDAVFSLPDIKRNGTYAEHVAVRASEIAHKPKTLPHVESASLPLTGITAWEALFTVAKLTAPGKRWPTSPNAIRFGHDLAFRTALKHPPLRLTLRSRGSPSGPKGSSPNPEPN
jgi:hypothetical protein